MARILVVDDESNIRLMVRLSLQASGHEVESASDGATGLDQFGRGDRWDIVLLDHRMPGIEGLAVLREMRSRDPLCKVIMITAFGTIDLAASALQAGASDFLRKPFTAEVLRGAVTAALEEDQQTAPARRPSHGLTVSTINGFRIVASNCVEGGAGGEINHRFQVQSPDGETIACEVVLPRYFLELVKAHGACDQVPDAPHFWEWLSEEALANHLWQNAELPPDGRLQVDELTTGLKRWIDAVLTR